MSFPEQILEYIKSSHRDHDTMVGPSDDQAADILNGMSNWELINLIGYVLEDMKNDLLNEQWSQSNGQAHT